MFILHLPSMLELKVAYNMFVEVSCPETVRPA